MDNAGYTTLTRQAGLLREMAGVANNIANMSTTGYRREGVLFAEHVEALDADSPSLSMASANVRALDMSQGALSQTGGTFDLAVEGEGFFLIQTPEGDRLTRAGNFVRSQTGEIVTPEGHFLLDEGGSPVFAPPQARAIAVGADGTLSADGEAQTRIGLYQAIDPTDLERREGVTFAVPGGVQPVEGGAILQGFLEGSNVNPVSEMTRMIEVQRAYEMGQGFLEKEDERMRGVIRTLGSR